MVVDFWVPWPMELLVMRHLGHLLARPPTAHPLLFHHQSGFAEHLLVAHGREQGHRVGYLVEHRVEDLEETQTPRLRISV